MADLTDECSVSSITLEVAEGYKWMMYRDLLAKELVGELSNQESGALTQAYQAPLHVYLPLKRK